MLHIALTWASLVTDIGVLKIVGLLLTSGVAAFGPCELLVRDRCGRHNRILLAALVSTRQGLQLLAIAWPDYLHRAGMCQDNASIVIECLFHYSTAVLQPTFCHRCDFSCPRREQSV